MPRPELQALGHDRALEGEEDEGERREDDVRQHRAVVAEAGAAGDQVEVDVVPGRVVGQREAGDEDDHRGDQDAPEGVRGAVRDADVGADREIGQVGDAAQRRGGDHAGAPPPVGARREPQGVVLQGLAGRLALEVLGGGDGRDRRPGRSARGACVGRPRQLGPFGSPVIRSESWRRSSSRHAGRVDRGRRAKPPTTGVTPSRTVGGLCFAEPCALRYRRMTVGNCDCTRRADAGTHDDDARVARYGRPTNGDHLVIGVSYVRPAVRSPPVNSQPPHRRSPCRAAVTQPSRTWRR